MPMIYDGTNLEATIESQNLKEQGFEIIKAPPTGYEFKHDKDVSKVLSEAN